MTELNMTMEVETEDFGDELADEALDRDEGTVFFSASGSVWLDR